MVHLLHLLRLSDLTSQFCNSLLHKKKYAYRKFNHEFCIQTRCNINHYFMDALSSNFDRKTNVKISIISVSCALQSPIVHFECGNFSSQIHLPLLCTQNILQRMSNKHTCKGRSMVVNVCIAGIKSNMLDTFFLHPIESVWNRIRSSNIHKFSYYNLSKNIIIHALDRGKGKWENGKSLLMVTIVRKWMRDEYKIKRTERVDFNKKTLYVCFYGCHLEYSFNVNSWYQ